MATGIHWEWRGFGELAEPLHRRIAALPPLYPAPAVTSDRYLWVSGCDINVKLRRGPENGLKFKRFLERQGQLELWEERPEELFPFPLEPAVFRMLAATLGLEPSAVPKCPIETEATLLGCLASSVPPVQVIEVRKRRLATHLDVSLSGEPASVIVEAARISTPQPIWSLALEETTGLVADSPRQRVDTARAIVEAARDSLGLPNGLRVMNYLEALSLWVRGEMIESTAL